MQWFARLRHIASLSIFGYTWRIIIILFSGFVGAVSVNNFLVPAHILAGGLTGIAQLVHHFIPVAIGTLYFIFNVPLFILGYKYLGKRFVLLTGLAILSFSVFADTVHLHFHVPENDPLLIALYGGVLGGLSSGLVIRIGGSMGGTDILSLVLYRVAGKSVGAVSFAANVIVVLLSMTIFGIDKGMYTLVAMFASSRVINAMMHYQARKTALIVSSKALDISRMIGERLHRGSTLMAASGTYTNATVGVLICALTHLELTDLRQLATEIDENVFITVLDTTEIFGKFRHLSL
jgi:uncharacterized membrane-anchored protein YitT (DUF2179 family)